MRASKSKLLSAKAYSLRVKGTEFLRRIISSLSLCALGLDLALQQISL